MTRTPWSSLGRFGSGGFKSYLVASSFNSSVDTDAGNFTGVGMTAVSPLAGI